MDDIQIICLTKSFSGRLVLRELSLTLPAGQITCLMAPSGWGKTTLLRLLAGLLPPDSGSVTGLPRRISFVFQEPRLCESFSALSNLRLVTGSTLSQPRLLEHLHQLGLSGSERLPVSQLSGGMRQRVSIARAVCYDPQLLLLDEPFRGLDAESRRLSMDYILRHCAGKTVLLATHDSREADYLHAPCLHLDRL